MLVSHPNAAFSTWGIKRGTIVSKACPHGLLQLLAAMGCFDVRSGGKMHFVSKFNGADWGYLMASLKWTSLAWLHEL